MQTSCTVRVIPWFQTDRDDGCRLKALRKWKYTVTQRLETVPQNLEDLEDLMETRYSQFAPQDLRPSGPNSWKVLWHYLSTEGCPGHLTLGRSLV